MSKVTALCMITLLLLLTIAHSVARPMAAFDDVTPMETHHSHYTGNPQQVEKVDTENECEGLAEDDCMMRRTLQANLDYIYTQKEKQP